MKICRLCQLEKDESGFYKGMGRCRECHKKLCVEWQKQNPDKVKRSRDRWRAKPGSSEKESIASRRWQKRNPEKVNHYNLKSSLKVLYGLSIEDYENLYKLQQGKCAICGDWKKRLNVDHNNITGKVRELLCRGCNTSLGSFKESILVLQSAIAYLQKHESPHLTDNS